VTTIQTITDPNLLKELERYREKNGELMEKFNELSEQIERQRISSYEDLQRVDQQAAETLVKLASNTEPFRLGGRAFGFFGLTSTGKSTMINKLIGHDLAATGVGETTKEIQSYDGHSYRLFDIPGRNNDISYFSMEYIAFWKGLTGRLVLITATIKEMTNVFHLLDAIHLRYDILINKFDLVPIEERQEFKRKLDQQIRECNLQGVDHIWYLSALNTKQFPHWLVMRNSLTNHPENVFDDYDPIDYIVYE
jgi:GTP-binding protein EngB required for normal cell division